MDKIKAYNEDFDIPLERQVKLFCEHIQKQPRRYNSGYQVGIGNGFINVNISEEMAEALLIALEKYWKLEAELEGEQKNV